LANIVRDSHLFQAAKKRAEEILVKDPALESQEGVILKKILAQRWEARLSLAQVS
jgi:hypothetical protein